MYSILQCSPQPHNYQNIKYEIILGNYEILLSLFSDTHRHYGKSVENPINWKNEINIQVKKTGLY